MKFDLTDAELPEVIEQVDRMILVDMEKDPAFAKRLQALDRRAYERGHTFYEEVYIMMRQHMAGKRAEDWNKARK